MRVTVLSVGALVGAALEKGRTAATRDSDRIDESDVARIARSGDCGLHNVGDEIEGDAASTWSDMSE